MGSMSLWHWVVVLVIVMVLFGAGKIPRLMGDVAKGVKAFKQGMKDDDPSSPSKDEEKKSVDSKSADHKE